MMQTRSARESRFRISKAQSNYCLKKFVNSQPETTTHHQPNVTRLLYRYWLTRYQCRFKKRQPRLKKLLVPSKATPLSPMYYMFVFISLLVLLLISFAPITTSEYAASNNQLISFQPNKHSGQFYISQLCGKSAFPNWKPVEGAVLTATSTDINVNCTITFKTRLTYQHFVVRFEELRLGCDDHLKMFDGDLDYGQPSFMDFSCRDSLASVPVIKTTGTWLTMRFSSDSKTKIGDGFRLVMTSVFDGPSWECPVDYALCNSNRLCISRSLFCDDINHCVDNSDEASCSSRPGMGGSSAGSFLTGELTISNTLGFLLILVVAIFICVMLFLWTVYCRRESPYAQYQHHLQRAIGVPLQTSSSLMFANHHQPQYHYFQPANLSPYITPQHHAAAIATSTLPRGYSTLPLNLARPPTANHQSMVHAQQQAQSIQSKGNNNNEYLMMAGLTGPPTAAMQAAPTMQTNLFLPTSQSILATGIRCPPVQESRQ